MAASLFDNVEPGTYTVTPNSGILAQVQENVLVQTRADVTVNFTLKPGGTVETVTVEGDGCGAAIQHHHARTDRRSEDADGSSR